ncbi:unnamed protein product [Amaranthus hypochondriacus]
MVIIDSELEKATRSGDIKFLKRVVALKIPNDEAYFLGHVDNKWRGNIFNITSTFGLVDFMKEALTILPTHLSLQLLSSQQPHCYGYNSLHDAAKHGRTQILKAIRDFYQSYTGPPLVNKPWLARSKCVDDYNSSKLTPLQFAIYYKYEECALEIMLMDDMELFCGNNMLDEDGNSLLFLAIQKGFDRVTNNIVFSNCSYSLSGQNHSTVLHVAPARCSGDVLKLLLKKHLDNVNMNVVRKWVEEDALRRVDSILDEDFCKELASMEEVNLFRLMVLIPNIEIVKKLVKHSGRRLVEEMRQFGNGDAPLLVTIELNREQHALYFLEMDPTLWDISDNEGNNPLLFAIEKGCEQVVKEFLRIHPDPCYTMLRRNNGVTILHLLKFCSEDTGMQLLGKFWWMINLQDNQGRTALDEARYQNVRWLVNVLTHPSSIQKEPFDWIKACDTNQTWALESFINTCNDLEEVCRRHVDTPLHHIKLKTYDEYRNFLKIPSIKELKNATDKEGATPLHIALKRKDIHFAKALLVDTDVERNIRDNYGYTALGLLVELCKENDDWAKMCKLIGVNPYLKTKYIQSRTNLDQMRNTLSVVAALLATITFAAAFTLPGGLNSETGYPTLAKKVNRTVLREILSKIVPTVVSRFLPASKIDYTRVEHLEEGYNN